MATSSTKKQKSKWFLSTAADLWFANRTSPRIRRKAISAASGSFPTPRPMVPRNPPLTSRWKRTAPSPALSPASAVPPRSSADTSAWTNSASPSTSLSRDRPRTSPSRAPLTEPRSRAASACRVYRLISPASNPRTPQLQRPSLEALSENFNQILHKLEGSPDPYPPLSHLLPVPPSSVRCHSARRALRHCHSKRHHPHRLARHHRARFYPY